MSGLPYLRGFLERFLSKQKSCNEDLPPYSECDPLEKIQEAEEASQSHKLQRVTALRRSIPTSKSSRSDSEKCTNPCQKCYTNTMARYHTMTNQTFEEAKEASFGRCHTSMKRLFTGGLLSLVIQDYHSSHENNRQHDVVEKATQGSEGSPGESVANEHLDTEDRAMYPVKRANRTVDYEEGSPGSSVEDLIELVRKERETWNKIYELLHGSGDMNQNTADGIRVDGMTQDRYRV